jgi:hypothetical protein
MRIVRVWPGFRNCQANPLDGGFGLRGIDAST